MAFLKVVVTGPVCAGKTTFIRTLADGDVVTTEAHTTDALEKDKTTVGLELGRAVVDGRSIRLFGTPGQQRFDYLWDIVAEGADGCVLLCPSDRPTTCDRSLEFVRGLTREKKIPSVVGVTRCDLGQAAPANFRSRLGSAGSEVRSVDARDHGDCEALLARLVTGIAE